MSQASQSQRQRQGQQYGGGQPGGGGGPSGQLFPTQNYLSEDVRVAMIETLNRALADTTVLLTHAKFAHWNVKGMEFYALHLLFDEIAETFEAHADAIGERITALGGQAMGTAGMAVSNCSIPSMPADAVSGPEYVEILADRLAVHDANLFEAVGTAQSHGDLDTADLLNEVSREVTQQLWFLEAHLQTQPVGVAGAQGTVESQGAGVTGGTQQPVSGARAGAGGAQPQAGGRAQAQTQGPGQGPGPGQGFQAGQQTGMQQPSGQQQSPPGAGPELQQPQGQQPPSQYGSSRPQPPSQQPHRGSQ